MSHSHNVKDQRSRDSKINKRSLTSHSIEGRDLLDFDMLHAKIASALKKIISNPHFPRRVSIEELRPQKHDQFLRGRQIAYIIFDHSQAHDAFDAAQDLSALFKELSHGDDIQDFETRWGEAQLTGAIPTENVPESLYKLKLRDSCQFQTVLALYDQEIDRDPALPSYPRLKTMVRWHIDQTVRTRNFIARYERIVTGVLVKIHKGRMLSVERNWTVFKRRLL